jgi:hypothetical protein
MKGVIIVLEVRIIKIILVIFVAMKMRANPFISAVTYFSLES